MTIDHRELEESLASLPRVASIHLDGDGATIDRAHIIANPDAGDRDIVDDVRALAATRFGMIIDRSAVTITQIATPHA